MTIDQSLKLDPSFHDSFPSCLVLLYYYAFRLVFECRAFANGINNFRKFYVHGDFFYFQTLHIGQMNILRGWLADFASHEDGKRRDLFLTNKIIEKHQRVINFSEKIENLYTYIALLQFTSNTIMICSISHRERETLIKLKLRDYLVDKIAAVYRVFANTIN